MDLKGTQLLLLFFAFLCAQVIQLNGDSIPGCLPIERNALLGFKEGLKDPTYRLSSWMGNNCCTWEGVACNNQTGHVVKLDLRNPHPLYIDDYIYTYYLLPYNKWSLGGELRPSLLGLKYLNYLDLSMNYFGGIRIPEFMGSFRHLKYLNLSMAGLGGTIPHQLGNLSSLQYLDLYNYPDYYFKVPIREFSIDNALWISHLSSLRYLNMTGVKFREGAHWLQALNMLPSIIEVRLSDCQINTTSLSLPHVNFSSLSVLDLSDNFINSTLPSWLFNISSLEHLDLNDNNIWGTIPPAIKNLASLKFLKLSYNLFLDGKIPDEIGGLCKLQYLGLSGINISKNLYELDEVFAGCIKNCLETLYMWDSQLSGYLPDWLGDFRMLKSLALDYNSLSGPLPASIGRLSTLEELYLSDNNIRGIIPPTIKNLASLKFLDLSGNRFLESKILAELGGLCKLQYLELSFINIRKNLYELDEVFTGCIKNSLETLNMMETQLSGYLPDWLGDFRMLKSLDLGDNSLSGPLPASIGRLSTLEELDLSYNNIRVIIPSIIKNLASLKFLYLSGNRFLEWKSLTLLGGLCKLQYLGLSNINISKNLHELDEVFTGCIKNSLETLGMSNTQISGYLPDWLGDFRMLKSLDLGYNSLSGPLPASIGRLSALEGLYLSYNNIRVIIPSIIKNLASLKFLALSRNPFLEWKSLTLLGGLCKLQYLGLSSINISKNLHELEEVFPGCIKNSLESLSMRSNQLSGYLPDWLGDFRMLKFLNLGNNSIFGPIPASLGRLSALQGLDLSYNKQLILNLGPDWIPPFQLRVLFIGSCKLGPRFPAWLRMQKNIIDLDLSSTGISDSMPDWFWKSFSQINYLDISNNGFTGSVPDLTDFIKLEYFNLSSNHFEGPLPNFNSFATYLEVDLSNNSFSGVIHPDIGKSMPNLDYLSLSTNNLSGEIPPSLCQLDFIFLDLSKNLLFGELPDCWNHSLNIMVMDFSSNNLSGSIPPSVCSLPNLESLHLSNNNLSGKLPLSLKSCVRLNTLDLGQNGFTGAIPPWIGESILSLKILSLRSNKFVGNIPPNLSRLSALQILDLSNNNLSGNIPSTFGNFTTMKVSRKTYGRILDGTNLGSYNDKMQVTIKGTYIEYAILLPLVIAMDLSDNNLSGTIPEELTSLFGLVSLNLSGNHLTGEITENMSELRLLESLDLSRNKFFGGIPSSMTALTFLSYLNVSYNNLSGRIPTSNQFQTFNDPSIYAGNPGLCGFPLFQKCKDDETNHGPNAIGRDEQNDNTMDEEGFEMKLLYMSMGPGFAVGFWTIFGPLLFNRKWREVYFRLVDQVYDMVYEAMVVIFTRFKEYKVAA